MMVNGFSKEAEIETSKMEKKPCHFSSHYNSMEYGNSYYATLCNDNGKRGTGI